MSGVVQTQLIRVNGSGKVRNTQLSSTKTSIDVVGSADMEIAVSSELDIEVDGSANISYAGQPSINKNVSGTLDLIRID